MEYKKLSLKNISANLLVYGTTHAVVDGICAAVVFSLLRNKLVSLEEFFSLVVLYNILAFGLQVIFGFITDYFKAPGATALLGCLLTGISALIFMASPILAIISAGIGNALFHIGGGSISLNLTPKTASAPGIFVAPGALGLLAGTLIGRAGQLKAAPAILILVVLCILMLSVKKPEMNYVQEEISTGRSNIFVLILILVFLSIAIRSLTGMILVFPWKTNLNLLIFLTLAITLGKALGGILADKLGWIKVAVGSLALSIPFLLLGANIFYLAIIGMFLFNITMPITLVAISNIMPGRPGLAFGLICLALIWGALPAFFSTNQILSSSGFILSIIVFSALMLYWSLKKYFEHYPEMKVVG